MTVFTRIQSELEKAIEAIQTGLDLSRVTVEPPRDPEHGDLATNAAMVLAKTIGTNPRELAQKLVDALQSSPLIDTLEIAGPGFINMRLSKACFAEDILACLKAGTKYGDCTIGQGEHVNIEFVSANPTGPMHAGHTRGAVIGDTLANLLSKAGYKAVKEYYFNDAGTQVDVLARTSYLRYMEALGEDIGEIPEGLYPGEYMKEVGQALVKEFAATYQGKDESEWLVPIREFAVAHMMKMIREDLDLINIRHEVFTNERDMVENGTLETAFKTLEDKGLIYTGTLPPPRGKEMKDWEPTPLTLFRSSNFGDSSDRPLKKRDGTWAYIMPDIAYHYDKIKRGFSLMVNVLGKDHSGYEDRIGPTVAAFSDGKAHLRVIYNAMVKVFRNGELVRFSKRSGNIITLREMVDEVGADVVRFFMMTRTPDAELEFDFNKVIEQSKDNPVFYVQYAYARSFSVMRHAKDMYGAEAISDAALMKADLTLLGENERDVIRVLVNWPRIIEQAATAFEPHRVAFYLQEVASAFHSWWNKGKGDVSLRFLVEDNKEVSLARLALLRATAITIASGLEILGVKPLEEMRSEIVEETDAAE